MDILLGWKYPKSYVFATCLAQKVDFCCSFEWNFVAEKGTLNWAKQYFFSVNLRIFIFKFKPLKQSFYVYITVILKRLF